MRGCLNDIAAARALARVARREQREIEAGWWPKLGCSVASLAAAHDFGEPTAQPLFRHGAGGIRVQVGWQFLRTAAEIWHAMPCSDDASCAAPAVEGWSYSLARRKPYRPTCQRPLGTMERCGGRHERVSRRCALPSLNDLPRALCLRGWPLQSGNIQGPARAVQQRWCAATRAGATLPQH